MRVSQPKTQAGIRTIPMLDMVYDAFMMEQYDQRENGGNSSEIDGMSGFVFCNRFGTVPNPQSVNRAIKRIISSYNAEETLAAKKEKREPLILPDFSCHHLRHTRGVNPSMSLGLSMSIRLTTSVRAIFSLHRTDCNTGISSSSRTIKQSRSAQ